MGFLGRIKDGIQKFNLWIVVVVAFGVYITFFPTTTISARWSMTQG